MKAKVVAILETRTGAHLAELIERRGGIPLLAPALEEVPEVDPQAVASLLTRWRVDPFQIVIFQTGVGTRGLFAAADTAGLTAELLSLIDKTTVVVRGPKPVGELNARGVRIDIRAQSPFTTETVLQAIVDLKLENSSVLVQRYGAANLLMRDSLTARGAVVFEIATYKWALPADIAPLNNFLQALADSRVDAVLFTSAVQMHNLFAVAEQTARHSTLAALLNRVIVGSIGPVCSRALREHGVNPRFEADPPKLGPMMTALEEALKP